MATGQQTGNTGNGNININPAMGGTALQLKLTNTNTINAEGTRLQLTDTTGVYNATTNPTGYGGPNTPRNQLGIFILGLNKTNKSDIGITFETYNPLTVSTFQAIIPQDGWYQYGIIGLAFYNASNLQNYDAGTVFYDVTNARIVRIVETFPDPNNLESTLNIAQPITVLDLAGSQYVNSIVDDFFIANNSKIKLRINAKISDMLRNNIEFTDKQLIRQKDNYNAARAVLQGAIYEYVRGNKYVAQTSIEFLNSNNYLRD